jgi:hypothetical protein
LTVKLTKEELAELYVPKADAEDRGGCPTSEELARSALGELGGRDRDRVSRHLVACSDCAQEFRLIGPLKQFSADAAAVIEESGLTARSDKDTGASRRHPAAGLFAWLSPIRLAPAIAFAALLICSVLVFRLVSLNTRNDELRRQAADREDLVRRAAAAEQSLDTTRRERDDAIARSDNDQAEISRLHDQIARAGPGARPELNVPIIDLDPRDSARGSSGAGGKDIRLPKSAASLLLILNITGERTYREYAIEIRDQAGSVRFEGKGLKRSSENTFTLTVPRSMLPPGRYRIVLYGLDGGQKALVQDYVVRLH